ncbi:hypothetical protein [Flagellimonas sp.]|uniref:hypothetical protein n=1 Tax=Flagellimonas sp. TaxID=2058762 RepID=UPI003B50770D
MNGNAQEDYSNLLREMKSWKSTLKHLDNELIFLERQLSQTDSAAVRVILAMKKRTKSLKNSLHNLGLEIISFEHLLEGSPNGSPLVPRELNAEHHTVLRKKIEEFQKSFKLHKTRVLRFTAK